MKPPVILDILEEEEEERRKRRRGLKAKKRSNLRGVASAKPVKVLHFIQ